MRFLKIHYKKKNWVEESDSECVFIYRKQIVSVRKLTDLEIREYKENRIDIPNCVIETSNHKTINCYNLDLNSILSIIEAYY